MLKKYLNGNTDYKISIPSKSLDPDSLGVLIESSRDQMFSSVNTLQLETSRKTPVVNQVVLIVAARKNTHHGEQWAVSIRGSEGSYYRIWALVGDLKERPQRDLLLIGCCQKPGQPYDRAI